MIKEVPAFLHLLLTREMKTEKTTRMWFTPEQIYTEALLKVKEKSRGVVEKEIREIIRDTMLDFLPEIISQYKETCIRFTREDILQRLISQGTKANKSDISDILRENWGLTNSENTRYRTYEWSVLSGYDELTDEVQAISRRGRFYTFKAEKFLTPQELQTITSNINNNP